MPPRRSTIATALDNRRGKRYEMGHHRLDGVANEDLPGTEAAEVFAAPDTPDFARLYTRRRRLADKLPRGFAGTCTFGCLFRGGFLHGHYLAAVWVAQSRGDFGCVFHLDPRLERQTTNGPKPLGRHVQSADQLRFDTCQQKVVVIAEPPAKAAELERFQGLLAPVGANRGQQSLRERLGRVRPWFFVGSVADIPRTCQFEDRAQNEVGPVRKPCFAVGEVEDVVENVPKRRQEGLAAFHGPNRVECLRLPGCGLARYRTACIINGCAQRHIGLHLLGQLAKGGIPAHGQKLFALQQADKLVRIRRPHRVVVVDRQVADAVSEWNELLPVNLRPSLDRRRTMFDGVGKLLVGAGREVLGG